jgi:hypothetical protein
MGAVHQLIVTHGRDGAAEILGPKKKPVVEIASKALAADPDEIAVTYSGFCLTGLPHKRPADNEIWERKTERVTLLMEPGTLPGLNSDGTQRKIGVPYGARGRLLLIWLQTEALRTGSREIEMGGSMRSWLGNLGISIGGETTRAFRQQANRLSLCKLTFFWKDENGKHAAFENASIVKRGMLDLDEALGDDRQGRFWDPVVVLDETFFKALQDHPVPLADAAIAALRDRSMAIDVYVWLAYRLHVLKKPTPVSWAALFGQFGGGFKALKHFKDKGGFKDALESALAAYPDARVTIDDPRHGIVLHPSPPPVPKRLVSISR